MTEPTDGRADHPDEAASGESGTDDVTHDVLGTFKPAAEHADIDPVNDATGRPRLHWSSVTDTGGGRAAGATGGRTGFRFDLGGALNRIGDAPEDTVDSGRPSDAESELESPLLQPIQDPSREAEGFDQSEPVARSTTPPPPDLYAALLPRRGAPVESAPTEPTPVEPDPVAAVPPEPLPSRDPAPIREPAARVEHVTVEQGYVEHGYVAAAPIVPAPVVQPPVVQPPIVQPPVADPSPRTYVTPSRSVFEDAAAAAAAAAPARAYVDPGPGTPVVPTGLPANTYPTNQVESATVFGDVTAGTDPGLPTLPKLPTLPPAVPAAPPATVAPISSAPNTNDLTALRSAQMRAQRKQRKGKLLRRTVVAFVVLGGVIGGALMFGRSYLFPTKWDATLTPIADAVQTDGGQEFDHTVPLVRQPIDEYAVTVGRLTIGEAWMEHVPEWRALGIAVGDVSTASVGAEIAARRLAVYDPEADRIFMADTTDADSAAAAVDLRVAVEAAYAAQIGVDAPVPGPEAFGLLGVSPPDVIAARAVARFEAELATESALAEPGTAADPTEVGAAAPLPLPVEYELAAISDLGEGVASALGADASLFAAVLAVLDDEPRLAASAPLVAGDRALADPVALGVDDWSLVWGAHLGGSAVERLADVVTADSYRPVDHSGTTCVIAVFETNSAAQTSSVLSSLATWAAAMPPDAQAVASALSETRVQLVTCDPGPASVVAPQSGVVNDVIVRQLETVTG